MSSTPITWRDIRAPNFASANSLMANGARTAAGMFDPLNNFLDNEKKLRDQKMLAEQTAAANSVYGQIAGGANPNNITPDFGGLGAQGADVFSALNKSRNDYFTNQGRVADTIGQQNVNGAFDANNTANLNKTKAATAVALARGKGIGIDNLTRGAMNQANIDRITTNTAGQAENNRFTKLGNTAQEPYLGTNAQNGSLLAGYKAKQAGITARNLQRQYNDNHSYKMAQTSSTNRANRGVGGGGVSGGGTSSGLNYAKLIDLSTNGVDISTPEGKAVARQRAFALSNGKITASAMNSIFPNNKAVKGSSDGSFSKGLNKALDSVGLNSEAYKNGDITGSEATKLSSIAQGILDTGTFKTPDGKFIRFPDAASKKRAVDIISSHGKTLGNNKWFNNVFGELNSVSDQNIELGIGDKLAKIGKIGN